MLHDLLTEHRDEILERYARKLRAMHPSRPDEEVFHTIPAFIDELIKAERREGGFPEHTPLPGEAPHARAHGLQRFQNGFTITQLTADFGLISDTIGEVAIKYDFQLDPRSYRLLNSCIDKAIADSIDEYFARSRASEELAYAEWLGSLGHELRNSLASANMAFEALKSGQVGIQSRTARVLERSLLRLESLVRDTLTAVQLRVGKAPQRMRIDVRELIDDVIAGARVDHGVRVRTVVGEGIACEADPELIESALSNLVQNAIKFTRPGGVVIVRAEFVEGGVAFEIEDECGGIKTSDPNAIFTPFVQGNQRKKGVGLGLTITRQAIEAHGGRVTVRNHPPKGCVFSAWLPR